MRRDPGRSGGEIAAIGDGAAGGRLDMRALVALQASTLPVKLVSPFDAVDDEIGVALPITSDVKLPPWIAEARAGRRIGVRHESSATTSRPAERMISPFEMAALLAASKPTLPCSKAVIAGSSAPRPCRCADCRRRRCSPGRRWCRRGRGCWCRCCCRSSTSMSNRPLLIVSETASAAT